LERAPPFVMRDLKLSTWNKVWLFGGIKYRNKELVSHLQTYVPYEIGAQINQEERGQKTIFLYMEEKLGIYITQIDQYMTIEPCAREDHEKLRNQTCDYKVVIKRIFFSDEQPVELSLNHHAVDSFSLFYRMLKTH
jgi:DNA-binding GntR family transcriptional regulator